MLNSDAIRSRCLSFLDSHYFTSGIYQYFRVYRIKMISRYLSDCNIRKTLHIYQSGNGIVK